MEKEYNGEKYADHVIQRILEYIEHKRKINEVIDDGLFDSLKPIIKDCYAMRRL